MRFTKPWGRLKPSSSQPFPFPAAPHLRTALLSDIRCFDSVAIYPPVRWRSLSLFTPQILAGTTDDLQKYAQGIFRGEWDGPVEIAIFNLTEAGRAPLSPSERDVLWRAFRAPVYEVLFDRHAGLLASECEAHEGWHVRHAQLRFDMRTGAIVFKKNGFASAALDTGLTAAGMDGMCACGDEAPLLRGIAEARSKPVRVRAAGA